MGKRKRNASRFFGAYRNAAPRTLWFLGQAFIIVNQSGAKRKRRYDLLGAPGTDLEGVLFKGVTHAAVQKFKNDPEGDNSDFNRDHFDSD